MQETTQLYKQLLASSHREEIKLDVLYASGTTIVHTFDEDEIVSLHTTRGLFADGKPSVGGTVSNEIDCVLKQTDVVIPRMAMLRPYVRLVHKDQHSEWIPKVYYWIDTRETDQSGLLHIHGYDAMLKGELYFDSPISDWPRTDLRVLNEISQKLGVTIQQSTLDAINKGYQIQFPGKIVGSSVAGGTMLTIREMLSYIGAMYCGNWIIDEDGTLRLVNLFTYEKLPVGIDFEASWSSDQSMQKYPAKPFSAQFHASTSFVVSAINYVKWDASTSFSATFSADVNAQAGFAYFVRCVLRARWAERITGSANPADSIGAIISTTFDVSASVREALAKMVTAVMQGFWDNSVTVSTDTVLKFISSAFLITFGVDVNADTAVTERVLCELMSLLDVIVSCNTTAGNSVSFPLSATGTLTAKTALIIPTLWQDVETWNDYSTFDTLFHTTRRE